MAVAQVGSCVGSNWACATENVELGVLAAVQRR